MIVFYTILCGFIAYISAYKIFKIKYISFIFCILFTFSYYRLLNVHNRAALGEAIAITFIPLIIWGAYEIVKGNYKKWYILAVGFSMLLFSHLLSTVIVSIAVAFYFILNYKYLIKEPIRIYYTLIAALTTIVLTSYFVFPFIEQLLSNDFYFALRGKEALEKLPFIYLQNTVIDGVAFKYIIRGLFSGVSYNELVGIGIVITFCCFLRIFLTKDKLVKKGDILLIIAVFTLLIISSLYPWQKSPFNMLGFIQFSWRIYTITTVLLAIAGSIYFYTLFRTDKKRYLAGIPFIAIFSILVISNSGRAAASEKDLYKGVDRNVEGHGLVGAEYLPQSIPNAIKFFEERSIDSIASVHIDTKIANFKKENKVLSFDVNLTSTEELELPLIYYKGYKAHINNNRIEIKQSKNGLIELPITESGNVNVYYGGTFIQHISPIISIIAFILLLIYITIQENWIRFRLKK